VTESATHGLSLARFKAILSLAFPIIAGMASQNVFNLVDTAMVGRLGDAPLAAVGIASIAVWTFSAVMQGLSPAVQAYTARRLGEGARGRLHEAIVNAIYLTIGFGAPYAAALILTSGELFTLLSDDPAVRAIGTDYMRIRLFTVAFIGLNFAFRGYFNGLKKPWLYMMTLVSMHVVNVILNYGLIFGKLGLPELGARGAALGSAIATTLGAAIYFTLMIRFRSPGFNLRPSALSRSVLARLQRLAMPSCVHAFSMALGFLLFYRVAGMISTEALAATNVLINLMLICLLIALGLGLSTITLVGSALGENDPEEAKAWVRGVCFLGSTALGLIGLALALFPRFWLGIFMINPDTIDMAAVPLVILGLSQSYDAAGMVLSHAHLGGGASKTVMAISFVNQWLVFLPACYVWVYFFDGQLVHIWICMAGYRFLQFLSFLISLRTGRWLTIAY